MVKKYTSIFLIFTTGLALAPTIHAETGLEEIVVTARFRAESVNEIGSSIAAYGAEAIKDRGIDDMNSLAAATPGLSIRNGGPNQNDIIIRGLGRLNPTNPVVPETNTVGVYFDDVPVNLNNGIQLDVRFWDIERVEVLRGPQGTLFGEGSEGGAIRYFSKNPDLNEFNAVLEGDVTFLKDGQTGGGVRGAVSIPLVDDKVGLRLVGNFTDQGGFIDSSTDGRSDINGYDVNNFRAIFLAEPNDRFRARIVASYDKLDQSAYWYVSGNEDDLSYDYAGGGVDELAPNTTDEATIISGNLSYDFWPITVESITSYYHRDRFGAESVLNGLDSAFFTAAASGAAGTGIFVPSTAWQRTSNDWKQFSQELRFISQFDGPLNFVAGMFYRDFDLFTVLDFCNQDYVTFLGFPYECGLDNVAAFFPGAELLNFTNKGKQTSFFIEGTWSINDQFNLIAGIRSHNEKLKGTSSGNNFSPFFLLTSVPPSPFSTSLPIDENFDINEVLPRVSLEYRPNEDLLLYGSYSEGLRNGNINTGVAVSQIIAIFGPEFAEPYIRYEPEFAKSFEAGMKWTLLDGTMQVNAAAYHTKIDGMQSQVFVAGAFGTVQNIGNGTSKGFELETTWNVNDNLMLFAGGNYTDAVNDDPFASRLNLPPLPPGITPAGTRVPFVPDYTLSMGGKYRIPQAVFGADLTFNALYAYTGDYTILFEENSPTLGNYGLFNFSVDLESERWYADFRVDNVFNTIEKVSSQDIDSTFFPLFANFAGVFGPGALPPAGVSFNRDVVNQPRMITLTVGYRFR